MFMRVCIIIIYQQDVGKLLEISKGLAEGLSVNGHQVDIIDGVKDQGKKVSFYDYIAIGTDSINVFGGKIPSHVATFLGQCGTVSGKRCFAFINKGGIRKNKSLRALMDVMEHEGMYLKYSEIISSRAEAKEIGKRLHIS